MAGAAGVVCLLSGAVVAVLGASLLPLVAGAAAVPLAARVRRDREARRARERRADAVIALCGAVAGELRAGRQPGEALLAAAEGERSGVGGSATARPRCWRRPGSAGTCRGAAAGGAGAGGRGAGGGRGVLAGGGGRGAGLAAGLERLAGALRAERDQTGGSARPAGRGPIDRGDARVAARSGAAARAARSGRRPAVGAAAHPCRARVPAGRWGAGGGGAVVGAADRDGERRERRDGRCPQAGASCCASWRLLAVGRASRVAVRRRELALLRTAERGCWRPWLRARGAAVWMCRGASAAGGRRWRAVCAGYVLVGGAAGLGLGLLAAFGVWRWRRRTRAADAASSWRPLTRRRVGSCPWPLICWPRASPQAPTREAAKRSAESLGGPVGERAGTGGGRAAARRRTARPPGGGWRRYRGPVGWPRLSGAGR